MLSGHMPWGSSIVVVVHPQTHITIGGDAKQKQTESAFGVVLVIDIVSFLLRFLWCYLRFIFEVWMKKKKVIHLFIQKFSF